MPSLIHGLRVHLKYGAVLLLLACPALAPAQDSRTANPLPSEPRAEQPETKAAEMTDSSAPQGYVLSPERAAEARTYARYRRWIYFLSFGWSLLVLVLLLRWRASARLRDIAERVSRRRYLQAIIFAPLLLAAVNVAGLPWSAARHWLAVRYEQSIQGWASWLWDWTKAGLLELGLGAFLVWVLYAVMHGSPRRWWFYGWLAALPILFFAVFISPWLVDPLFFEFAPLAPQHPDLANQINQVVMRAGENIPESRMYVMNASSKLNSLNAYVTGLGSSLRVVVWDTTIMRLSTPEALSVFGHEMGHYVLGHVLSGVVFAAGLMFLGLLAASRLFERMVRCCGGGWGLRGTDDWASLPVLLLLLSCLSFLATPMANAYSRHIEQQADQYALEVLHGIVPDAGEAAARSFQIMGEQALAELAPSRAVVFWFYSHPPINDRIIFARSYEPSSQGKQPQIVK
jgi:Zn-dependent protease with chaperone function